MKRAAALMVAALLAGCGSDDPAVEPAPPEALAQQEEETVGHIHGLGLDENSLFVATHHGLFTADAKSGKLTRVSESTQDVMGFSVAEDRLVGSGHPSPDQQLPPNLGLIESTDGGRTWRSVSLEGETDFHVLETRGKRVYGYDGGQGALFISDDAGRTWDKKAPPAQMFDLAIDPGDEDRIIASTGEGLFISRDAGARWRPLDPQIAGLLAWPSAKRLHLVDGQGGVFTSEDQGRNWRPSGVISGAPAAFMADGTTLYAARTDGAVLRSPDEGASWKLVAR